MVQITRRQRDEGIRLGTTCRLPSEAVTDGWLHPVPLLTGYDYRCSITVVVTRIPTCSGAAQDNMSSSRPSESTQLTDLQLAILQVLWTRGSATAAEVTEALRTDRGLAQQTIATVLSRLERRGIVSHETRQRQYVYVPEVSEPEVRRSMLADLTDRLFEGDVAALVTHLLSAREISRGDLARVKKLIAAHESKRGN